MKTVIATDLAPVAIGAYSQAIKTGNIVYVSGQIALNPKTMEVVSDLFSDQVSQVLDNLSAVADAADAALSDIVKLTVYLTDINNFAILNEVMTQRFEQPFPARAVVEVSALPKGVLVEMDAILSID